MNTINRIWQLLLILLAAIWLAGCALPPRQASVRLEQVAREIPGGNPGWQQVEPAEAGLRVWRDLRLIPVNRGMRLQRGDVVQTGPGTAAVLRFDGGDTGAGSGTSTLDENTRVGIGSLEVFFGRVFVNVRGFFETSSENVVAGVEGTRYLFEVHPNRNAEVAVVDGVVACRPRQPNAWAPVRVGASQALTVAHQSRVPPRVERADVRKLRDAAAWADQVSSAPWAGWCCIRGNVVPRLSNQCASGQFSTSRLIADSICRPPPPPPIEQQTTGWCCVDGQIYPSTREQCKGFFSLSSRVARQQCVPPPSTPTPPATTRPYILLPQPAIILPPPPPPVIR